MIDSNILSLPPWWTEDDTAACELYRQYEIEAHTDGFPCEFDEQGPIDEKAWGEWCQKITPWTEQWTCRRCLFWESDNGIEGDCRGPELECGVTRPHDMCEQWESRIFYELIAIDWMWKALQKMKQKLCALCALCGEKKL